MKSPMLTALNSERKANYVRSIPRKIKFDQMERLETEEPEILNPTFGKKQS